MFTSFYLYFLYLAKLFFIFSFFSIYFLSLTFHAHTTVYQNLFRLIILLQILTGVIVFQIHKKQSGNCFIHLQMIHRCVKNLCAILLLWRNTVRTVCCHFAHSIARKKKKETLQSRIEVNFSIVQKYTKKKSQ